MVPDFTSPSLSGHPLFHFPRRADGGGPIFIDTLSSKELFAKTSEPLSD
jgi:hypothetical protein